MNRHVFVLTSLVALGAACNKQNFPILYPEWDKSPSWAVKACGAHPVLCSDGGCCPHEFHCTSDSGLPIYRYPGYCRWEGPSF